MYVFDVQFALWTTAIHWLVERERNPKFSAQ